MSVYTWEMMIRDAKLTGRTRMIRRAELKPGDVALSSHYGVSTVKSATTRGIEGGTTEIYWEGGSEKYPRHEIYPGPSEIPLVMPDAYVVTAHHPRCALCNAVLDSALMAARLADEAVSTYNEQGTDGIDHGATVERETYAQRRAALA